MEKSVVVGRSLPLNIFAVLLNLTGVVFLVLGYHDSWVEKAFLFKIIGYIAILASVLIMVLFKGLNLMSYVSRVIIGGLFIVSGLIKANDPLGFSYKLEEYFEDGALAYRLKSMGWESFSLEGLMDYALAISIFVCIAEIVLGVAVIIGSKMKLAFWSLVLMMGFFTALTWHTKECDPFDTYIHTEVYSNDAGNLDDQSALKMYQDRIDGGDTLVKLENQGNNTKVFQTKPVQCVNDCGCFGDALKGSVGRSLSPKESFWKDLILLYFVIFIGLSMRNIQNNSPKENMVLIPLSMLVVGFFSWVFGWYFPILFALVVILLPLMMRRMQSKLLNNDWSRALLVAIASGLFVLYVLYYLPVKDYRPYAVGQSIEENMITKKDPVFQSISVYKNKETGETKEFSMEETMNYLVDGVDQEVPVWKVVMEYEKDKWEWKESVNKELDPGIPATITDFQLKLPFNEVPEAIVNIPEIKQSIEANKELYFNSYYICTPKDPVAYTDSVLVTDFDATYYPDSTYTVTGPIDVANGENGEVNLLPYVFAAEKMVFIVMKHLDEPSAGELTGLKVFLEELKEAEIEVVMFTAESQETINTFKSENGFENVFVTNAVDDKELKVVIRANPGIVALSKGVVGGKWSIHNRPLSTELEKIFK
jgi:uncharacterized membrane protein YphA (DoxX/SURF4 family)